MTLDGFQSGFTLGIVNPLEHPGHIGYFKMALDAKFSVHNEISSLIKMGVLSFNLIHVHEKYSGMSSFCLR